MRTGRSTKSLEVRSEERQLELLARRPKSSQGSGNACACRTELCRADMANDKVAKKLNVSKPTVGKWREGPSVLFGLYMNPPENALVLCVDEKSQVQALDRTADSAAGSGFACTPISQL